MESCRNSLASEWNQRDGGTRGGIGEHCHVLDGKYSFIVQIGRVRDPRLADLDLWQTHRRATAMSRRRGSTRSAGEVHSATGCGTVRPIQRAPALSRVRWSCGRGNSLSG
jgi:hypothetical protein